MSSLQSLPDSVRFLRNPSLHKRVASLTCAATVSDLLRHGCQYTKPALSLYCMAAGLLVHMFERQKPQSDWAHLSNELWSMICMLVSKAYIWPRMMPLHRLPLVCKSFRAMFLQQPHLCEHMMLYNTASNSLPSVILWIQRYGQHVKQCSQYANHNVNEVLATLLAHSAPLHTVRLVSGSATPHLIAAFSGLKTCGLKSGYDRSPLDLQPLQALPILQRLDLDFGQFTNVQAAAVHLTRLCLLGCTAICTAECECVTSLLHLQLEDATLTDFHRMGLAACCCLQDLHCVDSNLSALWDNGSLYLTRNNPTVPASLTALVCLTSLHVSFSSGTDEVTFDWFTCLTALQQVEASVTCPQVVLPSSFSALSNIRQMSILAQDSDEGYFAIKPMFDWKCLTLLEKVSMGGRIVACEDYKLSDMTSLTKLREVLIWDCDDPDRLTRRQLAELSYKLGKTRPDIEYVIEKAIIARGVP